MKYYKINSPAYRANGYHGTYCSIAICEDNGDFFKIFGDHTRGIVSDSFFNPEYKNIFEIVGVPFSDADRFIEIEEVKVDVAFLSKWERDYNESRRLTEEWFRNRLEMFGPSVYDYQYNKKGKPIQENIDKYRSWTETNTYPVSVPYYDFLKAIIHEN